MKSHFNDEKAGMQGLDREKIEKIIAENTNPNFASHNLKQRARVEERIRRMREAQESLTREDIEEAEREMDQLEVTLEARRDLSRVKVTIDMDAFYAQVEMRDQPELRDIPMAVGSDSMLSTSNYHARRFGVRSAMPGFIARRLCPQLRIVHGHFEKYRRESRAIREAFQLYDPNVHMGSLDEAYLDITQYMASRKEPVRMKRVRYSTEGCQCRLPLMPAGEAVPNEAEVHVEPCAKCGKERRSISDYMTFGVGVEDVVREIRFRVEQATGLTCSAGIAANSRLSKICSNLNKPNGQYLLPSDRNAIIDFMHTLSIRKVNGVGAVTEAELQSLDINVCGDLYTKRGLLKLLFSELSAEWFLSVALGITSSDDCEDAEDDQDRKSISVEKTFRPMKDLSILLKITRELCEELVESLGPSRVVGGRSLTVKIKFATFDVITRCQSVEYLISSVDTAYPLAESLLKREMKGEKMVRLLGVRLSNLAFSHGERRGGIQTSLIGFLRKRSDAVHLRQASRQEPNSTPELIELSDDDEEQQPASSGAMSAIPESPLQAKDRPMSPSPKRIRVDVEDSAPTLPAAEAPSEPTSIVNADAKLEEARMGKRKRANNLTRYFPIVLDD